MDPGPLLRVEPAVGEPFTRPIDADEVVVGRGGDADLQAHTRNPVPRRVVWQLDRPAHSSFYWLALEEAEPRPRTRIVASLTGQRIDLEKAGGVASLIVRLDDRRVDLDKVVRVSIGDRKLFEGYVPRTIKTLATTLGEREDPSLVFSAEISVDVRKTPAY